MPRFDAGTIRRSFAKRLSYSVWDGTSPGRSLNYDDRNRLTGMSQSGASAEYKINGRGERVVKTVVTGGGPFSVLTTTLYLYDEGGRLLGDYGAGGSAQTEYVYLDGAPIAAVKGGSLAYIETDHLGTPRVVADPATNAARWAWSFFGDTFGADAPDPRRFGMLNNCQTFAWAVLTKCSKNSKKFPRPESEMLSRFLGR